MDTFWAISVFFNPARYKSLFNNYLLFSERLRKQNVNLLTVELAFNGDDFMIPKTDNVFQLRSNSIMWQKERLINYGVSKLPASCKYFGWIDCDILFPDTWVNETINSLQTNDIVQLFKKIHLMPKNQLTPAPLGRSSQGVAWQKTIHKNWLQRRKEKDLPFSVPGFAWACRKDAFPFGLYDKNIIGSGDTFLVDCMLDSWEIHGYAQKFNDFMKKDMWSWRDKFVQLKKKVGYVPIDVCHLWHGNLKNRQYMDRHTIILDNKYDPLKDIKLVNDVFEWNTNKKDMHDKIRNYFFDRKEDDEE